MINFRDRARRDDALVWLGLTAAFLLLTRLIDPSGDFPLNDDHAYAWAVRHWLASGELRLSQWGAPSSLAHVAWGALFARLGGPGNETLRLSTVVMSWMTALAYFTFARRVLDAALEPALLAVAALALNPLYLAMTYSFHTDITYLFASLLSAACYMQGLRRPGRGWLWAGSAFAGAALLTRQFGLLIALGAAAALWQRRRRDAGTLAAALALPLLAAALFEAWFLRVQGGTWAVERQSQLTVLRWLSPLALAQDTGWRVARGACLLGLSMAPLAAAARGVARDRRGRVAALAFLAAGAALAAAVIVRGTVPFLGNTLTNHGLGVVTLHAPQAKAAGLWRTPAFWAALTLAGFASCAALAALARQTPLRGLPPEERALIWLFAPQALPLLLMPAPFDRYLLPVLPGLAAWALLRLRGRVAFGRGVAAVAALALLGVAGMRDYFAWHHANAQATASAEAAGIAPQAVDNGFDWSAQLTFAPNMERLMARRPRSRIGDWDWMALNEIRALTSFSARPPDGRFTLLAKAGYRTPLARGEQFVYLYARNEEAAGRTHLERKSR